MAHALQKSIEETSEDRCHVEDIEEEEADVPEDFHEDVSEAGEEADVPDKFYYASESRPDPEMHPALESKSSESPLTNTIDTVKEESINALPNSPHTDLPGSSDVRKGQGTASTTQLASKFSPQSSPRFLEASTTTSMPLDPIYPRNDCSSDSCPSGPSHDLSMEHQDNDSHIREQNSE